MPWLKIEFSSHDKISLNDRFKNTTAWQIIVNTIFNLLKTDLSSRPTYSIVNNKIVKRVILM